ncbi:MAG TPA: hypothetical protein VET65_01830 [Candidatus Limnocylindrales bacterium]|nr:hypothetical protein [Candidatus Limnocylindrales bacterium]
MMEGGTATYRRSIYGVGTAEESFACRAETADCTCPDNCERDHGND